ncbi:hypothetical protein KKD81_02500 [Patescibacteria group bacterium]|nr:hypothetical protein [Patescibacteria group bacterium]MBU2220786.1 hypothetical protein [Patescibacteria group bacterium]
MKRTPIKTGSSERVQKQYLYHMVPEDLEGTTLYPLNQLKEIHPELYEKKAGKYADRAHIMEQYIPTLEAAWNDVLHLTAVHPQELKKALEEAGLETKTMKFFQVDPELLGSENTIIYLNTDKNSSDKMSTGNFSGFVPEELKPYSELPESTKLYYKEKALKGERHLLFVGIPHILYKGSIDTANLPVITV